MRLLLIYAENSQGHGGKPFVTGYTLPMGISSIAAVARAAGHHVELCAMNLCTSKDVLDEVIADASPDVIGLTTTCQDYPLVRAVARHIRADGAPDAFLLVGGPHATLAPERFCDGLFDAICRGEGEYPTVELLELLERREAVTSIPNLWVIEGRNIAKKPARHFLQDLDQLPASEWSDWDRFTLVPGIVFPLLVSRGCAFDCSYCSNKALSEISTGAYVRFRTASHITAEIRRVTARYPHVQLINLETEMLNSRPVFIASLCDALAEFNAARARPLAFRTNIRLLRNCDWDELFSMLRRANIRSVFWLSCPNRGSLTG